LESALADFLTGVNNRGTAATLTTEGPTESLPEPVAALLYRAAREAVRNVLNHAGAQSVTVRVVVASGVATLDIVDDGVGFDSTLAGERAREGHFGLRGLTDRITDAGGTLQLESGPGTGTRVHVTVPIP
jgi:two-component system NarL family sensor kinase